MPEQNDTEFEQRAQDETTYLEANAEGREWWRGDAEIEAYYAMTPSERKAYDQESALDSEVGRSLEAGQ